MGCGASLAKDQVVSADAPPERAAAVDPVRALAMAEVARIVDAVLAAAYPLPATAAVPVLPVAGVAVATGVEPDSKQPDAPAATAQALTGGVIRPPVRGTAPPAVPPLQGGKARAAARAGNGAGESECATAAEAIVMATQSAVRAAQRALDHAAAQSSGPDVCRAMGVNCKKATSHTPRDELKSYQSTEKFVAMQEQEAHANAPEAATAAAAGAMEGETGDMLLSLGATQRRSSNTSGLLEHALGEESPQANHVRSRVQPGSPPPTSEKVSKADPPTMQTAKA